MRRRALCAGHCAGMGWDSRWCRVLKGATLNPLSWKLSRVPEEAPQEIADLVQRCTADAEARPDAAEIADLIQHHLRQGAPPALSCYLSPSHPDHEMPSPSTAASGADRRPHPAPPAPGCAARPLLLSIALSPGS